MATQRQPNYKRLMMNGVSTSSTPTMQVIEMKSRKYVCKRGAKNKWHVKCSYPANLPIAVGVIE